MNECRSYKLACTEQPYVHTQLAIAVYDHRSNAKYCAKERIKRLTSKYAKRNGKRPHSNSKSTANIMKAEENTMPIKKQVEQIGQPYERTQLAIATFKRLTSTKEMNECGSYKLACTEQPYVSTQLAIATSNERSMIYVSTELAIANNINLCNTVRKIKCFTQNQQISYKKTREEQQYGRIQQNISNKAI